LFSGVRRYGRFCIERPQLKPARLLETESYTERQAIGSVIKGNGGIYSMNHDMNRITVSLDGMRIWGIFKAHWSWSTKASSLIAGTEVQAMVDKNKLIVVTPSRQRSRVGNSIRVLRTNAGINRWRSF
jgi:hypothetical protein